MTCSMNNKDNIILNGIASAFENPTLRRFIVPAVLGTIFLCLGSGLVVSNPTAVVEMQRIYSMLPVEFKTLSLAVPVGAADLLMLLAMRLRLAGRKKK